MSIAEDLDRLEQEPGLFFVIRRRVRHALMVLPQGWLPKLSATMQSLGNWNVGKDAAIKELHNKIREISEGVSG